VNDRDLDAEFQRIVAGWDDEVPERDEGRAAPRDGLPSGADPAPASDGPTVEDGTPLDAAAAAPDDTRTDAPKVSGINPVPPSAVPAVPSSPADPAGPSPTDVAHGGVLGLPIASTTSHVWRASTPSDAVDDVDALLDAASAARGGEPDDHFVPPSEIDLPSAETDPMFWAIVGGLVGGPLLLLYLLFFDRDGSGWWIVTAIAMLVVGFVLLVLRGGTERDPFDDGTRV
jgi:hypothetical protein